MKRPIGSRLHSLLDYPFAVLLIASPWIFGFSDLSSGALAAPLAIGALLLILSAATDYEYSLRDALPLSLHLAADVLAGVLLAASPLVFGFYDKGLDGWLPHVVLGLLLIASGALTRPHRQTTDHRGNAPLAGAA